MKTPLLLDVPKTAPSRRDRLRLFKAKHGIETNYAPHVPKEDFPWLACHMSKAREIARRYGGSESSTLLDCQMHSCRLLDDAGVNAYGRTELESIRDLCENLKIECDL